MSDSALQPALSESSSRENRSQRDWKVFLGQLAAVIVILLGVLLGVILAELVSSGSAELASSSPPRCLVVPPGWQIVGRDPDTDAFFCLQSETGVYRLDCPVSVVECP